MAKYTKQQVQIIAENMRYSPIALLTGAGCSYSAGIPLASGFIQEISEKFPATYSRLTSEQQNDYGACMGALTPQQRSEILTSKLEQAKINWAHIAIASMINSGFINRVLTFNFDNILAKACGLMGIYPPTYDFATSKSIELKYIADKAIIHLHGQGHGMIKLNTSKETSDHAKQITPVIKDTVTSSSLLVIGYSGKSDAAFDELAKSYAGENRIYWCDHDESPNADVQKLIDSDHSYVEHLGNCDADVFLIELGRELGCFPPNLFDDPYGHLLEELSPVTEYPYGNLLQELNPTTENNTGSQYTTDILKNLRDKLSYSQNQYIIEKNSIEKLMMEGNWQEVINNANKNNPDHRIFLSDAYLMQAIQLQSLSQFIENGPFLGDVIKRLRSSIEINSNNHTAYNNLGNALSTLAKKESNESLYNESFKNYEYAAKITPDKKHIYENWGISLLSAYTITKKNEYLSKAKDILLDAEKINSDAVYNLACLYSISNEPENCKIKLLHCKKKNTLPTKKHIIEDSDLENVRNLNWFQEFISDLPN